MTNPYKPRDTQLVPPRGDFAGKAADQVKAAAERVEGLAGSAMTQGRDAAERVEAVGDNIKGAVDKSIKEQPMATLAIASALAFLLGALWKS